MKSRFTAFWVSAALIVAASVSNAQLGEESMTFRGDISNLDVVRVFLISQADDGYEELAAKHDGVLPSAIAELKDRSKALRNAVNLNGAELDRKLCNEGSALLSSKEEFDVLYIDAFQELDRANNEATTHALSGLPDAAYKFLSDELASIHFTRSGSRVQGGPPDRERAVQLSCGRLDR